MRKVTSFIRVGILIELLSKEDVDVNDDECTGVYLYNNNYDNDMDFSRRITLCNVETYSTIDYYN